MQLGLPSWQVFLLAEVDHLPAVCPGLLLGHRKEENAKGRVGLVCKGQR